MHQHLESSMIDPITHSTGLSCYILTRDSERRLAQVLASVAGLADELLILDSGSRDGTREIAMRYGARFEFRAFDNFRDQRNFAISLCRNNWVLELDSDEVASRSLFERIAEVKAGGFAHGGHPDAYGIRREWFLLGRPIHCFYPSRCPDQPIRLYRKDRVGYGRGKIVHETPVGFRTTARLNEPILHYTCDTIEQLYGKVGQYTTLLARDMWQNGVRSSWIKIHVVPWLLWLKFYLLRGGWRDKGLGSIHGRYVRDIVWQKYVKLKYDFEAANPESGPEEVTSDHRSESDHVHATL
jgi:glycosyltransferase involved in cell wall biosynthesis